MPPTLSPTAHPLSYSALSDSRTTGRIESIDALRGLVLFTMVFVNDVAGVPAAPWWMRHYHPYDASGMTFVDVVFPAFLFIVGMAIPFAVASRNARGETTLWTILHILIRTASLLLIGVFMVNLPGNAKAMGWRENLWPILMYLSAIAAFLAPFKPGSRLPNRAIRAAGFICLGLLAMKYRGTGGLRMTSLSPQVTSWWGILGLIGWAYLVASLIYFLVGANVTALGTAMALLLCVFIADRNGTLNELTSKLGRAPSHLLEVIQERIDIATQLGSQASITLSGVILSSILLPSSIIKSHRQRIQFVAIFIAVMVMGALLLHKPWGINKNNATPAWCLWCSAITAGVWLICYLMIDVMGWKKLARPLAFAGQNMLLAYLLSSLCLYTMWFFEWHAYSRWGAMSLQMGVFRSFCYATFIILVAGILRKMGIGLKL